MEVFAASSHIPACVMLIGGGVVLLHRRQGVGVDVEGDRHRSMPEPFGSRRVAGRVPAGLQARLGTQRLLHLRLGELVAHTGFDPVLPP